MLLISVLLAVQGVAAAVLWKRLLRARRRSPPAPPAAAVQPGMVTILLPTLNEAARIAPCLRALERQDAGMLEALVIDSGSTDATAALVLESAERDPRIRLLRDPPLPNDWIGKVWALQHGLRHARAPWVLGIDADIEPVDGFVGGVLTAAERSGCDVVSFSPCFEGQGYPEQFVQPALLVSLIYRTGAAGDAHTPSDRVLANGQCFLVRRAVLDRLGGYAAARASFSDDVTLARHLARSGARVTFLDGSALFRVRAYSGVGEMWREWGRSIALTDANGRTRQWLDVAFLALVQGAPLPVLIMGGPLLQRGMAAPVLALLGLNAALFMTRVALMVALRPTYATRRWSWWLSPLADMAAVLRVVLTTLRRPRSWRGRRYARSPASTTTAAEASRSGA